ncbi:MAG: hypothetical protein AAGA25_12700 [Planctomycetota bacterium]
MSIKWSNVCFGLGLILVINFLINGGGEISSAFISLIESISEFGQSDRIYALAVLMALAIVVLGLVRLMVNSRPRK